MLGVCGVSGWDVLVGYVYVLVLREVDFGDLEFCFLCVNVFWDIERCI